MFSKSLAQRAFKSIFETSVLPGRKNIFKGFLGVACCLCLVTFVGCQKNPPPPKKIVLWHWLTDREAALQELAKQYNQETGIIVAIELFAPSDSYSQKVMAAAQANVLPDIYGILDKKTIFADFVKAGLVADLTDSLAQGLPSWASGFFDNILKDKAFEPGNDYGLKPGIYGVPIDATNMQFLYNKKLLAKAGIITLPSTFKEFIKDAQVLKRVGIVPFVSGWGEIWMIDCFASNYAFNIMGQEKVLDTFRGKVKYTDPDWIKVLNLFVQLRDRGVLMDGIVTKGNKYAESDFALQRAAFAFNGSWCVNVYHGMNPNLDYGVMMPPPVGHRYPLKIWGSAGSSFVVNAASIHKTDAIAFLKWLTAQKQQEFLAHETYNLPSNKQAAAVIPPILKEFARGMSQTTHPNLWPVNEDPLVSETFDKGIQAIIIGEKTPMQVAVETEVLKEQQMAKGH